MADTQQDAGYVVLTEEPNLPRAHWVAGALEGHGIPVHVEDDTLQDEFAISQKAMGLIRVRVLVPAERLDEARTVFLGLSQPIPLVDEDGEEDYELDSASKISPAGLVLVAFLLLTLGAAIVTIVNTWQASEDRNEGLGGPFPPPPEPPRLPPIHR